MSIEMKQLIFVALMLMGAVYAEAKDKFPNTADSLRIVGFQHDFEDPYISRKGLNECIEISREENPDNWVDTVIIDPQEMRLILSAIKRLRPIKRMRFCAEEYMYKGVYSGFKYNVVWSPEESLDYRLLILVFLGEKVKFVWVDSSHLERGYYRYKLSDDMKTVLGNYTQLFDRE